jgi:organic hydroperoxide reductase OsmC/OhrA
MEFSFPVDVRWLDGRCVRARVADRPHVTVAPPMVFYGAYPHAWSPEDLLVAAAASCLAITFTGLAERAPVALALLHVEAEGTVGRRDDGRFGFTAIRLRLCAAVDPADVELAQTLAARAESDCLIAASLALPVEVEIDIRAVCRD